MEVEDPETGKKRIIQLSPKITAEQHAQKLLNKVHKREKAPETLTGMIQESKVVHLSYNYETFMVFLCLNFRHFQQHCPYITDQYKDPNSDMILQTMKSEIASQTNADTEMLDIGIVLYRLCK